MEKSITSALQVSKIGEEFGDNLKLGLSDYPALVFEG